MTQRTPRSSARRERTRGSDVPKLVPALAAFKELGISPSAGYDAIANGTLPIEPIRVGWQWKFRRVELDRVVGVDQENK